MTKKIKKIIRKYGLTQRQIARELGVTEVWVSYVLHRKGKSMRILRYIAKQTNTPIEKLVPPSIRNSEGISKNPSYRKAA